jgi:adenylylsulfate kinase
MAYALWLTGLPGSGKTTIATHVAKNVDIRVLSLDMIREHITPSPTYSRQEKDIVYRTIAFMGYLLYKEGISILIDATDSQGIGRQKARELIPELKVIQLKAPLNVCKEREEHRIHSCHHLYKKAEQGKIAMPGVNEDYLLEKDPALVIDTQQLSPLQAADHIITLIRQ